MAFFLKCQILVSLNLHQISCGWVGNNNDNKRWCQNRKYFIDIKLEDNLHFTMLRHLLNHKSIALLAILFAVLNTFQVVYKLSNGFVNVTRSPQRKPGAKFDDSISGLAWFVQVSDLHFSIFIDENRSKDFLHLCKFIKQSIQVSEYSIFCT